MSDTPPTHPLSLESWLEAQIPQTKLELALGNINRASLPLAYILGLRPLCSIATALDLCLLCWYRTGERHCPKVEQLATAFSILSGKDTFLYAGTGFGKTLAAILHVYLERRNGITIIVTPLTRIQASHASSIESVYGFRVLVVNEQTTRDKGFWKAHVHDVGKNRPGDVQVILATPEQLLQSAEGHYSRLGQLLREPGFRQRVRAIIIDEAHSLYTVGLDLHGIRAFRKVYGRLHEIKALFGTYVPWLALTATAPRNMLKVIEKSILRANYTTIQLSVNRPNLMYACHQVVGSATCFDNFLCFLTRPFNLETQPRVLIAVEDSSQAVQLALFLRQHIPPAYRDKGVVRHQHSNMSPQYKAETHAAFADAKGSCRVLVATSMEMTGVDHQKVDLTCVMNERKTFADSLQAAGRTMRSPTEMGLVIFFYESWVAELDLSEFCGDADDVDRPYAGTLTEKSKRKERMPHSYAAFIQSKSCRRSFFARYLNDEAAEALTYVTDFCCDNCSEIPLDQYLPSALYVPDSVSVEDVASGEQQRPKKRPCASETDHPKRTKDNRDVLRETLQLWRKDVHDDYPLRAIRPRYYILEDGEIEALCKVCLDVLRVASDVTAFLKRSEEWGGEWAQAIIEHMRSADNDLRMEIVSQRAQKAAKPAAKRQKGQEGKVYKSKEFISDSEDEESGAVGNEPKERTVLGEVAYKVNNMHV